MPLMSPWVIPAAPLSPLSMTSRPILPPVLATPLSTPAIAPMTPSLPWRCSRTANCSSAATSTRSTTAPGTAWRESMRMAPWTRSSTPLRVLTGQYALWLSRTMASSSLAACSPASTAPIATPSPVSTAMAPSTTPSIPAQALIIQFMRSRSCRTTRPSSAALSPPSMVCRARIWQF